MSQDHARRSPATGRGGLSPALAAQIAIGAVLVAHLIIVEVQFASTGGGKNTVLTVAKWFGLHTATLMMLQIVLISRIPWLDRRLGMDQLTRWHRWVGFALFWMVLTHFALVVIGYALLDQAPLLRTFLALAGVVASLLGMLAAAAIVMVGVTSARRIRRRLSYERWHALHMSVYLAIGLGLVHQMLEGTTFGVPAAAAYWWILWTLVLLTLLGGRVALPLWRNARHRYTVAAVVPESDTVTSIYVTGRDLERLPALAGQFCIWRFPEHNGWWQANPFSLSAAPDGRSLRLTAKAVGTTSAGLRNLPVGSRVVVEGPYGAFTTLHQRTDATLLIAGGVGITPIRAMLEQAGPATTVLYRVRDPAEAVLLGELQALARARGARLHLLTGRTGDGQPPVAPFAPENLVALVPDITRRDVYVCGPPAMTDAVLRSLRVLRVPGAQVHAERFSLG